MRRFLLAVAAVLCAATAAAGPADLALSLGTASFLPDGSGSRYAGAPGIFASAGATLGLSPRLEAGAAVLPRVAPDPFDDLFVEARLGYSLYGNRSGQAGAPGSYYNAIAEIGWLGGLKSLHSGKPSLSSALLLRFTPIAMGNPFYGRRDRILTVNLLFDLSSLSFSFRFDLFSADFFLASSGSIH